MSTRQTKRRMLIWWAIVVLGVVLAVNLTRSIVDFLRLKSRLIEAQERLEELRAEQKGLEKEYSYKTTADYLEKEVRERLNMAKPGEIVVIIPEAELMEATETAGEKKELSPKEIQVPVWQRWWQLFF